MALQWAIEVCLTCGRQAKWPFCEHRPEGYKPTEKPWCMTISVRPTAASAAQLRRAMADLPSKEDD